MTKSQRHLQLSGQDVLVNSFPVTASQSHVTVVWGHYNRSRELGGGQQMSRALSKLLIIKLASYKCAAPGS